MTASSNFDREDFYKSLQPPKGKLGCATILGLMGTLAFGGLLVFNFIRPDADSQTNLTVRIIFGVLLAVFLYVLYAGLKPYNPEKDETLKIIKSGGNNIIWIYPYEQTVNGFTSYWVKFMTKDGKTESMATVTQEKQQHVISGLAQLYPDAVLGYSDEIRDQIRQKYNF